VKIADFVPRFKAVIKKAGTKTLIACATILVLGCVVALNFILSGGEKTGSGGGLAVDLTKDTSNQNLQPDDVQDYFASITLQRKQARDEAIQVLTTVAESPTALEEAKTAALEDIQQLALEMEMEANIETLVLSKGFEECVAVISDGKCSVIVETSGLLPGEVAQISEIVYEQSGIVPANLKIIEKNTKV